MKEKKQAKKLIYTVGMVLFLLLFLGAAAWLVKYFLQLGGAKEHADALKDAYVQELNGSEADSTWDTTDLGSDVGSSDQGYEAVTRDADGMTEAGDGSDVEQSGNADPQGSDQTWASDYPGLEGYEVPEKEIDFEALRQEVNADIYAWVTVPGTVIDYPVVQHPDQFGYYLDHNLDHSKGYPGCIYSELYNSKEWDDSMTVLYGHNMLNGTMFAGLHSYEDSVFFEENPYIYIYAADRIKVYEIFAAYEYNDMDLVQLYKLGGKATYESYLGSIYTLDGMNNNFNTDVEVTAEDKILTLSTCIKTKPENRYLVQGKLVAEGPYIVTEEAK